ncbi:DUF1573 domain-containing protein [Candidatus Gracilibacteria bacterium]|nr:DUF1573 domain-containing protein [Candidatus Gracilibacteria bacterium]
MKKIILFSIILFLLAGCSNSTSNSSLSESPASMGIIEVDKNNIDLQEILILGGDVKTVFTFRNIGDEPVELLEGVTTCMCTEAFITFDNKTISPRMKMYGHGAPAQINQILNPDESAVLTSVFDPLAHGPNAVGPIMREIIIKTNSLETPEVKFRFLGDVVKK